MPDNNLTASEILKSDHAGMSAVLGLVVMQNDMLQVGDCGSWKQTGLLH